MFSDDIIETESGLIIEPRNSELLAQSIIKLLSDKELMKVMGENGRLLVKTKYEWQEISKRIYELYEELL